MRQKSHQELDSTNKPDAIAAKGQRASSSVHTSDKPFEEEMNSIEKTAKTVKPFTNYKRTVIGLLGALLISYMTYNLVVNYWSLI